MMIVPPLSFAYAVLTALRCACIYGRVYVDVRACDGDWVSEL